MAISPILAMDTFSRTATNSLGMSDSGVPWAGNLSLSSLSVDGERGLFEVPANAGQGAMYFNTPAAGIPEQAQSTVVMRFKYNGSASSLQTDFGPMINYKNNSYYGVAIQAGQTANFKMILVINGTRYIHGPQSYSYPFVKDAEYWVKLQLDNDGIRARVWRIEENEPSTWQLSASKSHASGVPTAGTVGVWRKGTTTSYWAFFSALYYYSGTGPETTAANNNYASDTFNGRTHVSGWGRASSGHAWEGMPADDPYYPKVSNAKFSVGGDYGKISISSAGEEYVGVLGPPRGGNYEVVGVAAFGAASGGIGVFRIGLRGELSRDGAGNEVGRGYALQIQSDSTAYRVVKKTGFSNVSTDYSVLGSANLTAPPALNEPIWCKLQVEGTTLRARCWRNSESEPVNTWPIVVTDTAFSSGRTWLSGYQTSSGTREIRVHDVTTKAPTVDVPVPKNYSTMISADAEEDDMTDVSLMVRAYSADDENDNKTFSARYRPTAASAWIPFTDPIYRYTQHIHYFYITNLRPETSYTVEVTLHDADGVQGANPYTFTATTSAKKLVPENITLSNVTTNSVQVAAKYIRDIDQDSAASLYYRATSREVFFSEDLFLDPPQGSLLDTIAPTMGGNYVKHMAMTSGVDAKLFGRYFHVNTKFRTDKVLYYNTNLAEGANYAVEASFFAASLNGTTGVAARISSTEETYYGAGINADTRMWEIFKVKNGVKTVLDETSFASDLNTVYTLRLNVSNAHKDLYVNGQLILTTSNNDLNYRGYGGWYSSGIVSGDTLNQWKLGSFAESYRTPASSAFTLSGGMTVNRTTKTFNRTLTGLQPDTIYEIVVNYYDEFENQELSTTFMTTGNAAKLQSLGAVTYPTSAVLSAIYAYDLNNNSSVTMQYRATNEQIWTTVQPDKISANRGAKMFTTTIAGLKSTTTYEAKVTITDPDGILEGSVVTLPLLFTTKGFSVEEVKQGKQYVWKIYNREGTYLTTIPDAPDPEFAIYENGGVTDLTFTLPRKMSESYTQKTIDFQNRVDIWAVDPSSNGMGPNLLDDPDCDMDKKTWTFAGYATGTYTLYYDGKGPDGSTALHRIEPSNQIFYIQSSATPVPQSVPLVASCIARAQGGKFRFYMNAYDVNDMIIGASTQSGPYLSVAETVGSEWQKLQIEYTVPPNTAYVRLVAMTSGYGNYTIDKFSLMAKEVLIYRGRIESFTPKIDEDGESVEVEVLGLASLLSDDYIDFLQFVDIQPNKDVEAGRKNYGAADPADMMKRIINEARRVNPMFTLYYTSDSIRNTGIPMQYTFKDQQIRSAMDKVRSICPSGWHYYIEPDGLVVLRGAEHAPTHVLRIGAEVLRFEVEKSIRNLKNYIRVKGRQDEDETEADGYGSINYVAFDQASINKYGKRTLFIRDSQLIDPESAKLVGDGRLDENNREEQRGTVYVPDEKSPMVSEGPLKGYNIESFRAGDNVIIIDALSDSRNTYWDQFNWDEENFGYWDTPLVFKPISEAVPIKTVRFRADHVELELSERPPSSIGDFSKLYKWFNDKDKED